MSNFKSLRSEGLGKALINIPVHFEYYWEFSDTGEVTLQCKRQSLGARTKILAAEPGPSALQEPTFTE